MRSFITVSGHRCTVTPISRKGLAHWERQCTPMANVEAPEGFEFSGGETALAAHTAKDLDVIEQTESLTPVEELPMPSYRETCPQRTVLIVHHTTATWLPVTLSCGHRETINWTARVGQQIGCTECGARTPTHHVELVSTDKLNTGDKVLCHGRVFELTDRNEAEGRTDYRLVGPSRPVIWFHTRLIETLDDKRMPEHWAADWTVQGNHLAVWSRIVPEERIYTETAETDPDGRMEHNTWDKVWS